MARGFLVSISGLWLALNFVLRSCSFHAVGGNGDVVPIAGAVVLVLGSLFPALLPWIVFFFGLSLPLYGFQAYTIYNQVFEFWVVVLAMLMLFRTMTASENVRSCRGAGMVLLGGYAALATLSLLELPLAELVHWSFLWGPVDLFSHALRVTPENPLYSLLSVNRIILFCLLVCCINRLADRGRIYASLLTGIGIGALAACLTGLLNQFDLISLTFYRPDFVDASGADRLHSVFGNPGWFAEYIAVCFPLLFLLSAKKLHMPWYVLLSSTLLVGFSLLLTGSRTGWIVFALTVMGLPLLLRMNGPGGGVWRRKIAIVVLSSILVTGIMIAGMNWAGKTAQGKMSRIQYLGERISHIAYPEERLKLWHESLALYRERPVFGLGYGAYRWHTEVMQSIPGSDFSRQRKTTMSWETPHNFFLHLAIDIGAVGLLWWLALMGYAVFLLVGDVRRRRNPLSRAVLGMLAAFHLYGLSQSMQYVPAVWLLAFLCAGYAFTLEPFRKRSGQWKTATAMIVLFAGAAVSYAGNFASGELASRYGLARYAAERGGVRYRGFYSRENWGKDGFFRWTGRKAEIVVSRSGRIRLALACFAPRLDSDPLAVTILLNGRVLDQYTFHQPGRVNRIIVVPGCADFGKNLTLKLEVSRTWCPRREGLNADRRNLGVAVGEPRFLRGLPSNYMLLVR